MTRLKHGLYRRLLGVLSLFGLAPALLLTTLTLLVSLSVLEREILTWLNRIADEKAEHIATLLQEKQRDARLLALRSETGAALLAFGQALHGAGMDSRPYRQADSQYRDYLAEYAKTGRYHDLLLIDAQGNVVFSVAREKDLATNLFDGPYRDSNFAATVRQTLTTLSLEISPFEHYAPSDMVSSFLALPVFEQGEIRGVIALQFDYPLILSILKSQGEEWRGGEVLLGQRKGEAMLYMSSVAGRGAPFDFSVPIREAAKNLPMYHALAGNNGAGIATDYRGSVVLAAWRYLPLMRWGLVVQMDKEQAFAAIRWLAVLGFLLLAVVGALVVLTAKAFARSLAQPLWNLTRAAQAVAAGDFTQKIAAPLDDEVGQLAASFNDMGEKLHDSYSNLERLVQERTARLAGILEVAAEAIISIDARGNIGQFNFGAERIFGYTAQEALGKPLDMLLPQRYRERHRQHVTEFAESRVSARLMSSRSEVHGMRKNGEEFPAEASISRLQLGDELLMTVTLIDISDRKISEQTIRYQATHDTLTSLPNRLLFRDRLEQAVEHGRRDRQRFALLFIDLDGFKSVNDTLGHHAGDLLLQEAARRLGDCVRESDTVARVGGDEFTIILHNLASPQGVAEASEKIRAVLSEPVEVAEELAQVSCSIGITLFPDDANDASRLITNADEAMYDAKRSGKNVYRFYKAELSEETRRAHRLLQDLRLALKSGEQLEAHYQPLVDFSDGRLVALEALVRWKHPAHGYIPPDQFIPLSEQTGLIADLGERILRQVCGDRLAARDWLPENLRVAVNVSPRQFMLDPQAQSLRGILAESRIPPAWLTLEITESLMLMPGADHLQTLQELRDMGLLVALDDFGTGYSSLSYLKQLPADYLKIDKAFVRDIPGDPGDAELVTAIINLAHTFGLKVCAEGVETAEQWDFLRERGCDLAQGFHISKPLPLAALRDFVGR